MADGPRLKNNRGFLCASRVRSTILNSAWEASLIRSSHLFHHWRVSRRVNTGWASPGSPDLLFCVWFKNCPAIGANQLVDFHWVRLATISAPLSGRTGRTGNSASQE